MLMGGMGIVARSYPRTSQGFKDCDQQCVQFYPVPPSANEADRTACRRDCMVTTGMFEQMAAMRAELEAQCAADPESCVSYINGRVEPSSAPWLIAGAAVVVLWLVLSGGKG